MYQAIAGLPRTRTISTVGRIVTGANRPARVYRTQAASGLVAPGNYQVDDIGLGFSLNPLNLIKSAIGAVKGIFKNSTVSLPTTSGTVTVRGDDLGRVIRASSVQVAGAEPTSPTAMQQFTSGVEAIPGGWMTVAALGVGAIALTAALARRR